MREGEELTCSRLRLARLEFGADFAKRTGTGASRNQRSSSAMCDYSLHHVKSRPAKVGDKLMTRNFNTGTRGFASPDDRTTAVCVLSGTHTALCGEMQIGPSPLTPRRVLGPQR